MKFRKLGQFCDNCGLEIESRPATQVRGVVITGFEPMDHRHVYSQSTSCAPVVTVAKPHNDCGLYKKYRAAMENSDD